MAQQTNTHNTITTPSNPLIEIPIIDISSYLNNNHHPHSPPDPSLITTSTIAQEIHAAARSPGFFQIIGHNIPAPLRSRLLQSAQTFFALPAATKTAVHKDLSSASRGYEGIGDQVLEAGVLDRKEGFTIGVEWGEDAGAGEEWKEPGFLQGRNQWPGEEVCPGFRAVMTEYFGAMRGLSKAVFRYPPVAPEMAGTARGVGAHTDFGAMTLLLQDDIGGLEVFHRPTQTWHPVQPVKNAFVVNIGDMMERWTNGMYMSTLHRVISPASDRYRYSVAFFNEGRLDQTIECISTCLKPGEKPKYEPVTVEAHMKKRYWASYSS